MKGDMSLETATLGGGCFWCLQPIFQELRGVSKVEVGYAGGHTANPSYEQVCTDTTGHAEVVQVAFVPDLISCEDVLKVFFSVHDPTTLNRQGHDVGTQYRSAIFYHDEEQRRTAERVKERVERSGKWQGKIVTEIVPAGEFYPAEEYHQKYLVKHPGGYTCHYLRD